MKCYCPTAHMDCSTHMRWGRKLPSLKPIKSWTALLQRNRTKMPLLLQAHEILLTNTMASIYLYTFIDTSLIDGLY